MLGLFHNINENSSDEELMRGVAKGNRRAFEMLYDRYFDRLAGFGRRLLANDYQAAEDIVQELFMKIIHQPQAFDAQKKFSTWAYTVVKNKCFNYLRNEQNRKELAEQNYVFATSVVPHSASDAAMLKKKIARVFETLNEKEKALFVLRFEQELSIQKIAEIIEIPEGSVKSGIYYMLKKIAAQLKDYIHEN